MKDFLDIDQLKLDEEWIRQPGLYFKHATRLADARTEMANAKQYLEITYAEVATRVRTRPGKYDLPDKPNNDMVNSAVLQHQSCREAQQKLIEAEHKVRVHEAVVSALEHKRSALTRLVELKQMDYFSEPSRSAGDRKRLNETIKAEAVRRTMKHER